MKNQFENLKPDYNVYSDWINNACIYLLNGEQKEEWLIPKEIVDFQHEFNFILIGVKNGSKERISS